MLNCAAIMIPQIEAKLNTNRKSHSEERRRKRRGSSKEKASGGGSPQTPSLRQFLWNC
jgi:hypothetical protein